MALKPRKPKSVKREPEVAGVTPPEYNIEAAGRACYETYVRESGLDQGTMIGGKKKLPSQWAQLRTFHRSRWRTIAQAVIDAATGTKSSA